MTNGLPPDLADKLRRAERLEWITIGFMVLIIAAVGLVMGSSQAMQTAWVEDILSLIPPAVFLIATRLERRGATTRFPFGFERTHSIAFLVAAVALATMGAVLAFEAVVTLVRQERPTIGTMSLFGEEVWQGWPMIGVLALSTIPPVILGRMKYALAIPLRDKVLHTDALMNKADWLTGLAGIAGVLGIAFGFWWADAVAALIISLDILWDGIKSGRIAVAELADSVPRQLDSADISEDALDIAATLKGVRGVRGVRMRETGRFIDVTVDAAEEPPALGDLERALGGNWRVANLSVGSGVIRDAEGDVGDPKKLEEQRSGS
jgi:cobalt-zinc-cadmium efflux system protein